MSLNPDTYQRLEIKPLINANGYITTMGGSIMPDSVVEAMVHASRHYIPLNTLHAQVSARIAELTGAESAFVCAGAASGLLLAGAACLTGTDAGRIQRLPQTDNPCNEFVISLVDPHYYVHQGFQLCGGKLVKVGTREAVTPADYQAAIGEHTAAAVFFLGRQPKQELGPVIDVAHAADVPVIVDAADQVPPRTNLTELTGRGADLVVFSGGKGLRGPQCTGLILGRKDLVEACRLNSSPHSAMGRGMKVGKEEIAGLLAAVELFMSQDEDAVIAEWERRCRHIGAAVEDIEGLKLEYHPPFSLPIPPGAPRLDIHFDAAAPLSARDTLKALEAGDPSIMAGGGDDRLRISTHPLQDGEAEIIARRLGEILRGS